MLRIKKYYESTFIKSVSGIRVNFLTLNIYNEAVEQEYKDHIRGNQFQNWTFWLFSFGLGMTILIYVMNLLQGEKNL